MTPRPEGLYQHLSTVSSFFETHHVPYMVVGGIAVGVWASPRATIDLDFLVGVDETGLPALIDAAKQARFTIFDDRPMKFKRITMFRMLLRQEDADFLTIDCLLADDDYTRQALARAVTLQWEGRTVRVATAEDVILLKLLSAREHDLVDTRSVVQHRTASLDYVYLAQWAGRLGVGLTLREILPART